MNNRLHDKIFIVDDQKVVTGGRNIGDNYYLKDAEGKYAYDRDIMIYTDSYEETDSVIHDFNTYYDELYNHEFTQVVEKERLDALEERGIEAKAALRIKLENARNRNETYMSDHMDWEALSLPTNKISLLTNPIERLKKSPRVLRTLNDLMINADDRVIAQTPYLIWNDELKKIVDFEEIDAEVHFLTNSEASSNNFPGVAGFLNLKDDLLNEVTQVYGFQGNGSIHAKTYVIDQRLSLIGSFNFDPRSAFLSTENLVVVDSEPFTEALTDEMLNMIETSKVYIKDGDTVTD